MRLPHGLKPLRGYHCGVVTHVQRRRQQQTRVGEAARRRVEPAGEESEKGQVLLSGPAGTFRTGG